jgi:hypothetical protein
MPTFTPPPPLHMILAYSYQRPYTPLSLALSVPTFRQLIPSPKRYIFLPPLRDRNPRRFDV